MRVFISYTRRDPDKESLILAQKLARFLASRGMDVIFDELTFRHSKRLADEMIEGIYSSDKFVFLASPAALESKYVIAELGWARDRAIELQPDSFMHVVCVVEAVTSINLPRDLRASICHFSAGKSERKLLHELFLSLHGVEIGHLIKRLLIHDPNPGWLVLERYQELEVLNGSGDIRITTTRTVLNVSNTPRKHTTTMNVWAYGQTEFRQIDIEATDEQGTPLSVEIDRQTFRGEQTTRGQMTFSEQVDPGEVFTFRTFYEWPEGINIWIGDSYTLDCEDMVYGYLRLDFLFPRLAKASIPTIKIRLPQSEHIQELTPLGSNRYRYESINVAPGTVLECYLQASLPDS